MRTKATLFLLVLVVALGAVAYYFNREWDAKRSYTAGRSHVLGPEAVDLDFLQIEFAEAASPVVLEKRTSGWELISPVRWPANFFAVNRLLSQLQSLERDTSFPAQGGGGAQSLADYGLDPPEGRLVYGRRGARRTLKIGRVTDVGNRLYVQPEDGDRVHVVNRSLRDSLQLSIEEFRSESIFTLPLFEVRSWNVQLAAAGNLRVWLSRSAERWRMETPVQARADRAAVESLLGQILGVRVVRFESGPTDLNVLRLATPDFIITYEGSGRRESLLIGAPAPGASDSRLHYAKLEDNPTVFVLEAAFLDELRDAQISLRERRLLDFDASAIQSMVLLPFRGDPLTLQRLESGQWQVVSRSADRGPVILPGDGERIEALLTELAELRAVARTGFVTDAPSIDDLANTYALASPRWQVVVTERTPVNETRAQTLMLGGSDRPGGDHVYARLADAPSIYLVDRGLADDLSAAPQHYRDRQLQQLPQGARVNSLALRPLIGGEPVFSVALATPEQTWTDALARQPEALRDRLISLINQLRNLRAQEVVATEFSSSVPGEPPDRPWSWLLEAVILLEGGVGQQTSAFRIYLDAYSGGTTLLAATPDLNLVFRADQPFIDAFGPFVFQREDPGPPPPGADKPPGAMQAGDRPVDAPPVVAPGG